MKKALVVGAISPEKIATSIAHHQVKTNIGGHAIFLGQVRADEIDGKTVKAIDSQFGQCKSRGNMFICFYII